MIPFQFHASGENGLRLLCLGAHCDDIEIGCGGALLALQEKYEISEIRWEVFASTPERKSEAENAARAFIGNRVRAEIHVHDYRDAYLQESWAEIKDDFETIKQAYQPDLILTHYGRDKHQDHRLVSELTWNTFRNHLILEYEIPKYDGDLGRPNLFIPVTDIQAQRKVDILLNAYQSQADRHWFEADTFLSLMRLRGLECGGAQKYAEGFYARKAII